MRHVRAMAQALAGFLLGTACAYIPVGPRLFVGVVGLFGLYLWIESRSER